MTTSFASIILLKATQDAYLKVRVLAKDINAANQIAR